MESENKLPKYKKGDICMYEYLPSHKNECTIREVHIDEEGDYYTIRFNGIDIQTIESRLSNIPTRFKQSIWECFVK